MLDKCRATLAGTQGEYKYPCPLDKRLLDFSGITADQFSKAAREKNEAALAEWFRKTATPHSADEIEQWNRSFLNAAPDTDEKRAYHRELVNAIDPSRTDITTWVDMLDLDEKRPVPKRGGK
jgi:hypothetical protein